ncbi:MULTISPECIES: PilN domain-containing protein [Ferrimonas]|uniref:PilN domain-containing protein n=1 Tax=Ferrimonas TaxID=44011 RepID=UPI0004267D2E|nr:MULTISPECIES: PilN domain-containing protein [Ferrimonas]USD37887.1 PilN domain-containing protein [Ferrimonas sp. SCSIO 43195]
MAHINLLPWRETRRQQLKRRYLGLLLVSVLAAVVLVVAVEQVLSALVASQQQRNQFLQQQIGEVERRIAEVAEVQRQSDALHQRLDLIVDLQRHRSVPVHLMSELHRVVVPGVYLTELMLQGSTLRLSGFCESNNHLANLLRQVDASPWLFNARVQEIVASRQQSLRQHRFSLSMSLSAQPRPTEEATP